MAVFMTEDKTNLILDCKCGCDDAIKFKVDLEDADADIIMFATLLTMNFFSKQENFIRRFADKVKRIWGVIRNKDYCYGEVVLTKEDFRAFKKYINQFDV